MTPNKIDFIKRTVVLHGGYEVIILTPKLLCETISAMGTNTDYYVTLANGSGYSYLAKMFFIGTILKKNEIIYLPFLFNSKEPYGQNCYQGRHFSSIVLFNYCTAQISVKDILTALKTKNYQTSNVNISVKNMMNYSDNWVDYWKTTRRLTIKQHSEILIISTNGDLFGNMAGACLELAEYGDDIQYNKYPPHKHFDWSENTSNSLGITLCYWQDEEKITEN